MNTIAFAAASATLILLAGCSSYQSTHVIVDEFGVAHGEKFDGVPITVTIPQKIGFWETVSTYEVTTTLTDGAGTVLDVSTNKVTRKTVNPAPVLLGPSELFALDAKRPASGTGNSKFLLDKDKLYPTDVSNNVTDNTIKDLTAAAETVIGGLTPQSDTSQRNITERLIEQTVHLVVYDPKTGQMTRLY